MNKIVFNSIRLRVLSQFESKNVTNYRNLCKICINKQNYLKLNDLKRGEIKTNFWSLNRYFKSKSQTFEQRINFSTFSPKNSRLNQIHRNEVKDKGSNSTKDQQINEWQQLKEMSLTKKLKFMLTKYWYISIPVHFITSCLWFGTSYLIAKSGFDVNPILEWIRPYAEKLPLPEFVAKILKSDANASSAGYLAIALIIYKLCTPARYASTVGVSFYAIQYSVKRGLIRPAPSGKQIKAQVIKSRSQLNDVLRDRLAKREQLRKKTKPKHKTK